jgi:hypothetical protein
MLLFLLVVSIMEIQVEMQEITPTLEVPITLHVPVKILTAEERKEMYAELRKYQDIHLLPLPHDFFDDDVESERGLTQLQHDAHMVGLLDNKMIQMSAEKESALRKRLRHKINLLRESRGLPELGDIPAGTAEGVVVLPEIIQDVTLETIH